MHFGQCEDPVDVSEIDHSVESIYRKSYMMRTNRYENTDAYFERASIVRLSVEME